MLIAPTEPPALRALGRVSMTPERFGCDLLFAAKGQWAGIQRKEFKDLIASIEDGRLGEQIARMKGTLKYRMIVVEGSGQWTLDGELMTRGYGRGIKRSSLRKLLWSIRAADVWIDFTDTLDDTIALIEAFEVWCKKGSHKSLNTRPAARQTGGWGSADNRDWQLHLLQGLPGIGIELAERILDTLGMPLGFTVTREELLSVEGLGPKKVEKIMKCLPEKDWSEVVMSA